MEKEKKYKRKFFRFFISKVFFINLAISIGITIVLILALYFGLNIYTNHGDAISVPDFTGMTIDEVIKITKDKSLSFEIVDSVYSDDVDRGTITNQVPLPNHKVKRNRKIYLTINSHLPQRVQMPDFVDLELRAATALAETYGLKICDKKFVPNKFPTILKQLYKGEEIRKGTWIEKGACIDLIIGRGGSGERVLVPKVIGLTKEEAENKLTEIALNTGAELYDKSVITHEDSINAKIYKQSPMNFKDNEIHIGGFIDIWLTIDNSLVPQTDTTKTNTSEQESSSQE